MAVYLEDPKTKKLTIVTQGKSQEQVAVEDLKEVGIESSSCDQANLLAASELKQPIKVASKAKEVSNDS